MSLAKIAKGGPMSLAIGIFGSDHGRVFLGQFKNCWRADFECSRSEITKIAGDFWGAFSRQRVVELAELALVAMMTGVQPAGGFQMRKQ
jgi:hypothetical protein